MAKYDELAERLGHDPTLPERIDALEKRSDVIAASYEATRDVHADRLCAIERMLGIVPPPVVEASRG